MPKRLVSHRAGLLASSALTVLACVGAATGTTFAPGTSPEYIRQYKETLARIAQEHAQAEGGLRFTPAVSRRLRFFLDEREFDPSDRAHQVWWSYTQDGTPMEPSNATLLHAIPALRYGQVVDPIDDVAIEDRDNFASRLFLNLNGLPRPYGFADDGGQRAWQTIVAEAVCRWGVVSGIEFRFVPGNVPVCPPPAGFTGHIADQPNADGGGDWDRNAFGHPAMTNVAEGDIRIAMGELDGAAEADGSVGGILAWTYDSFLPPSGDPLDDNGTPDDPLDDIITFGYCGNIILDKEEKWNDPATPNLLATVITREIGFALGLFPACPANPIAPFSVLQAQEINGAGAPGDQDPLPQLFFQELQEDDIRAVQFVYGDTLEVNDIYADARDIFFMPVPGTNVFSYQPHLGIPQSAFPGGPTQLSIGSRVDFPGLVDIDRFRLGIPDSVTTATLRVSITPRGTPYTNAAFMQPANMTDAVLLGSCDPVEVDVDPSAAVNLRLTVEAFDPFTNILQVIDDVDANPAGEGEETEIPVTTGSYFITVTGNIPGDVQLYDIVIEVETPLLESGLDAVDYLEQIEISAFRDEGFFGANATIGVVDGQHVAAAHDTFFGRTIPRVAWPGNEPAVTSAGRHATSIAAVAAGAPIGAFDSIAPEAQIASATIATTVFGDGTFAVGKNALYFALFGLTQPGLSASLGLPSPATVVVSGFGGGGLTLTGEDSISQAFDAAASASNATFVVAAGNNGQAEGQSFANCPRVGVLPGSPGTLFQGSRSVVPPATAFNVISVGSTGTVNPVTSPAEFTTTSEVIVPGFSSRGPIDSSLLTTDGQIAEAARSGIDIIAPGTGLTRIPPNFSTVGGGNLDPCDYSGAIPESLLLLPTIEPGDDPNNPVNPGAFGLIQGTSVSAAIVAGAVALLQDVALDQSPPLSTYPWVMKAVLLTGAEKLEGWTNTGVGPGRPQDQRDGFERNPRFLDANPNNDDERFLVYNLAATTTNPLDRAQGAGALNLRRSLEIFFTGYPPADPPQAQFEGPTIDPAVTDPRVPTIRMPDEPSGTGGGTARAEAEPDSPHSPSPPPLDPAIGDLILKQARGFEPTTLIVTPMQQGRDPDIKFGSGGLPGFTTTGPQTPFQIPSLGGDGPAPPQGTPGATEPGVRPREIGPIFVDPIGWDHANIDQRPIRQFTGGTIQSGFIDYIINVPLLAERPDPADPTGEPLPPDRITITLCWPRTFTLNNISFSNPNNPVIGNIRSLELENLELELFTCDALGNLPQGATPVRASISQFNNTEHIFTEIPVSSLYLIRVRWLRTDYDFRSNLPLAEQQYGIAWRVDFSPRPEASRPAGITELASALARFGGRVGNTNYDMNADYNLDGRIDWKDILGVLRNWDHGR